MTDRPIIFSAPMIRALLGGTKTQTRRVLKPQPVLDHGALGIEDRQGRWIFCANTERGFAEGLPQSAFRMPYAPGNRLWVREAWGMNCDGYDVPALIPKQRPARDKLRDDQLVYFATETDSEILAEMPRRPSIHMPRWASRLTLAVADVRVQRLNEISEEDAVAEGVEMSGDRILPWKCYDERLPHYVLAASSFRSLWDSLHGPGSWSANPWIVAVSFVTHMRNIDHE